MPRLAANLGLLFTERPLIERFAVAHAAGFDFVELLFPYSESPAAVKKEVDRLGLTLLGLNTATGPEGEFGLGALPGRERDYAALFRQALDYAIIVGARQIHCMCGVVPVEQRPAAERVFVRNLTEHADLAAKHGVALLIEPINKRDRPNYFLSSIEQAADIVAKVGRPNVRIQFDCYHTQILSGDLIKRFERHLPVIGHVQIAGVPTRNEPDIGEVNYPEVFKAIDRLGYSGFVAAEYKPAGKTEDGLGWARPFGIVPRP